MIDDPTPSETSVSRADRVVLYCTVFVTGSAVMMLELLGTRIIGPFYGVSLFVWSSLISTALIALSIGYYLGGLLADRYPSFRLAHAIAISAVSSAFIPLISGPVLQATNTLGIRAGAFFSALVLFSVPLTFLGMVGPYVIKLATSRLEGVGLASGSVYAVSTVGSVLGTLLLGFFLLPTVGSKAILYGVSTALFVLAIIIAFFERQRLRAASSLASVLVLGFIGMGGWFVEGGSDPTYEYDFQIRSEGESAYGWVRVVDDRSRQARLLLSDSSILSALRMDPGRRGETLIEYLFMLEWLPHIRPGGKDALLIGLGGGYVVGALLDQGVVTDAIELDPLVAAAAKEWFRLRPPGKLIVGDARYEIKRLDKTYDFIIHDCFTGGSVPSHLLSVEMFEELKAMLNPGGILALNFVGFSDLSQDQATASVSKTLDEVFLHQRVFSLKPENKYDDFLFFASDLPMAIDSENAPPDSVMQVPLERMLRSERQIPGDAGFVVTDDFNPLESMQVRKAEAYRERFLADIGTGMMWR